jgi:bifunctional DNA-binding transcriptional regulator/antitoxin component of YhaV-PrlF toxin-antitoxin module
MLSPAEIVAKPKECYNTSERSAMMVIVQLSKDEKLILPESLGRSLGLREGDRVEVRRQDDVLWLQRKEMSDVLGPLTDLSKIISSSRPIGSVDVEEIMDKHGYEQIDERSDR